MQGPYHIAALPGDSEQRWGRSGGGGAAAAAAIEIASDEAMRNARLRRQPGVVEPPATREYSSFSWPSLVGAAEFAKREEEHQQPWWGMGPVSWRP